MVIVLSVLIFYVNSVELTFYMVIFVSVHVLLGDSAERRVLYVDSAERTCFVC
jgi:hypothetical protein